VDSKEIRELIELVSRSSFSTFELERNGFRIKLVKDEVAGVSAAAPAAAPPPAVVAAAAGPTSPDAPAPSAAGAPVEDGLHAVNSPIVGTFYSAPSPEAANFVEVGAQVQKGQVLCIVEAMKVMNEIESEIDAEVIDVLVANGQPVEYGEILFQLRPS
jgi:acetyl-CoA carboxylase biotin carboxyl carrier protein